MANRNQAKNDPAAARDLRVLIENMAVAVNPETQHTNPAEVSPARTKTKIDRKKTRIEIESKNPPPHLDRPNHHRPNVILLLLLHPNQKTIQPNPPPNHRPIPHHDLTTRQQAARRRTGSRPVNPQHPSQHHRLALTPAAKPPPNQHQSAKHHPSLNSPCLHRRPSSTRRATKTTSWLSAV